MNMHQPLTELERQHLAHKERQRRFTSAAIKKPRLVEPAVEKQNTAPPKVENPSAPDVGFVIPLYFQTFKRLCIVWVAEYCPYAGGSTEVAINRSMTEIAIEWLGRFRGICLQDVKGNARNRRVVFPRQVIMHSIKKELPDRSFPEVGRWTGGRDHTTVMHACNKIQSMIDNGTFDAEMANWQQKFGRK
ncbi:Chromosomal replication initiator protein DnaA [compost metagenome]